MWIPFKSYEQKARYIIEHNNYAVIGTANKKAEPWCAAVFYAHDEDFNFYFISAIDSLHTANIAENPKVSMVIFDSRSQIGNYDEVQMYGKASIVQPPGLRAALDIYGDKLFSHVDRPANRHYRSDSRGGSHYSASEYTAPSEFRVYKVAVTKAYTTAAGRRTEINFKKYEKR